MRRPSDNKPSPSTSWGAGRGQPAPVRRTAGAEAFGRFVRTLARLEGKPGPSHKDGEGRR